MKTIEVSYGLGPLEVFRGVHDHDHAFFLDSADTSEIGQYSVLGYGPDLVVTWRDGVVVCAGKGGEEVLGDQPWEGLRRLHSRYQTEEAGNALPFGPGLYGYFGYEFGATLQGVTRPGQEEGFRLGVYPMVLVADTKARRMWVVARDEAGERAAAWARQLNHRPIRENPVTATLPPGFVAAESNITRSDYVGALGRIKDYIAAGDVYQVNFAHRFTAPLLGGAFALYERLRQQSPAPYAAYLNFDSLRLVSSSPERFLSVRGTKVSTRPIKGTRPRGVNEAEDNRLRDALLASEKDRAELLMIVDLERNDLGRVCAPGSIKVAHLYHLESHPTVWHLVAEVSGRLAPGSDVFSLLAASFPGGSITGAPKIRALQIIDELETDRRDAYTGTIGYIGFDGNAELNIAIRTIQCRGQVAHFHVGSGVVWDSDPAEEYEETLVKARAMAAALGVTLREKGQR